MTGIYSTDDRLSLIRAVNITNGVVDGFNIRTETPICIPQQKLIKETEQSVFRCVGAKEYDVIGRVAGCLMCDGFSLSTIAHSAGVSVRTIRRYITLNEMA